MADCNTRLWKLQLEKSIKSRIILKVVISIMMFGVFALVTRKFFLIEKMDMPAFVIVNITTGIVALLGLSVLFLVHIMDTAPSDVSSRLFSSLIVTLYLGVMFENISWLIDYTSRNITIRYLLDIGGFLVTPIMLILFWNYQNKVFVGESHVSNRIKKIVYILAFFDFIFIIIGSLSGFIFYVDVEGNYFQGPGAIYACIYPGIVVFCCAIENLKRNISYKKKFAFLFVGLVPAITIVSSILLPEYSFWFIMFYMALILIYGTVQSQKSIELAERDKKIAEQKEILVEQQTQIMISQMQPHFLYNTLTAIYQLCEINTELAQKTIQDFSSYLRENMEGMMSTIPIGFEKELAHTKTYLEIESLRFGDILRITYDIQVTDFEIPSLTLQPLVENAVKYGIRSRECGGTVSISTKRENGKIYVLVQDDGMGFDPNEKKNDDKTHMGIENTRKRLQLMMNADLIIHSEIGVGTTAMIVLEDKNEFAIG